MKRFFVSMLMAIVLSALSFAQNGRIVTDEWLSQNYTKREVMVKVRDGIHIYTVVLVSRLLTSAKAASR